MGAWRPRDALVGSVLLLCGPGQAYPSRTVWGATPGKQQLDDVQVVVMHGHVQGSQAILRAGETDKENSFHSEDFLLSDSFSYRLHHSGIHIASFIEVKSG